jgi:hypothetical protein
MRPMLDRWLSITAGVRIPPATKQSDDENLRRSGEPQKVSTHLIACGSGLSYRKCYGIRYPQFGARLAPAMPLGGYFA